MPLFQAGSYGAIQSHLGSATRFIRRWSVSGDGLQQLAPDVVLVSAITLLAAPSAGPISCSRHSFFWRRGDRHGLAVADGHALYLREVSPYIERRICTSLHSCSRVWTRVSK